jgi:hypothetical protein
MGRPGLDYHCLRFTLRLFNYKPLYENPDKSKKILAPILDHLLHLFLLLLFGHQNFQQDFQHLQPSGLV